MTWTYDASDVSTNLAKTRFLCGDTDASDQLASDEEINFALAMKSDNVYSAAAMVCRALASKFAREVDTAIESAKVSKSQRSKAFQILADNLETEAANTASIGGYVGGVTEADMLANEENTDRIPPLFRIDTHNSLPIVEFNRIYDGQG